MVRPHTLDQTDVYEYVVQNAFLQARGTLPPSARASHHQSEDGSNKQSWKQGQYLTLSYTRHMKNMLLGYYSFGAEQLQYQALIWKT